MGPTVPTESPFSCFDFRQAFQPLFPASLRLNPVLKAQGCPAIVLEWDKAATRRFQSYLDHTATAVEPFWIDHLFFPLGRTV